MPLKYTKAKSLYTKQQNAATNESTGVGGPNYCIHREKRRVGISFFQNNEGAFNFVEIKKEILVSELKNGQKDSLWAQLTKKVSYTSCTGPFGAAFFF